MVACAAAAAIAIKVPALFGRFDSDAAFYQRNISFFALLPLAAYFA
jgi:hypothetical protein